MIKIVNRLKKGESTLCTFTVDGREIKEGDVLGYGDNYPCIVLYNPFEAKFELIEFGYNEPACGDCKPYITHDLLSKTSPFRVLGDIDRPTQNAYNSLAPLKIPENFDYVKDIQEYYKHKPGEEEDSVNVKNAIHKYMSLSAHQKVEFWNTFGYTVGWKKEEQQHIRDKLFCQWVKEKNLLKEFCSRLKNNYQ